MAPHILKLSEDDRRRPTESFVCWHNAGIAVQRSEMLFRSACPNWAKPANHVGQCLASDLPAADWLVTSVHCSNLRAINNQVFAFHSVSLVAMDL